MSIEQNVFDVVETEDGWNSFETTARIGADIWARLANQACRDDTRFRYYMRPRGLASLVLIKEWADLVVAHSQVDEGDDAPVAVLKEGESSITLGWDGTWTAGRRVRVEIFPAEYPEKGVAYIRFNTGTGKPSTFLGKIFTSAKAEAEDIIIPEEMAKQIRSDLAFSYGGYSQFGTAEVIAAVCGHIRNGTLLRREKSVSMAVIEAALLQEEERWEDQPTPTSEGWLEIHKAGDKEVGECWEQQRKGQGARSSGAPTGTVRAPTIVD